MKRRRDRPQAGPDGGPASQHAERSGVMRLYAPAGHWNTAEIGIEGIGVLANSIGPAT